jgi:transposase
MTRIGIRTRRDQLRRRRSTIPGSDVRPAAVLIARQPELGQLDHRRRAGVAGLYPPPPAPRGTLRGKRHVRGGRADVRRTLYLAAFIACRYDPTLGAFRNCLQHAGKPTKRAIGACAGKLLTSRNAIFHCAEDHVKHDAVAEWASIAAESPG